MQNDVIPSSWRRALGLLLACALLAMLLSVDWLYAGLQQLLAAAKPLIEAHPLWGGLLFVALSALSAMLAFFSSALLMPVALVTWGPLLTILLLWLGWLLGGASAYALGRYVGRPLVRSVASARVTEYYLKRLPTRVDLPIALLVQFALPSEIPGYLFGTLRVRFRTYLLALALVEALGNAAWTEPALAHKQVIDRCGRFPHRNAILGRESTPDELDVLAAPLSWF
jgi:uncharacterized membrane protein YdjX (TVP38/TMEM64 family)